MLAEVLEFCLMLGSKVVVVLNKDKVEVVLLFRTVVVEEMGVLGEVQQGFRKGRCGADNSFVLHTILQQCAAKGRQPHMAFIDIQKV